MADPISPVHLASLAAGVDHPGAWWRLDGEDLQANLVRLGRGDRIVPHRNDEVEVLVVVVFGRRDCRWVGLPSDAEVSRGKPPSRSARLPIRPVELWARRQVVRDRAPKDGEADDPGPGQRGLEDIQVRNLAAAAIRLLERAAGAPAGRAALTLIPGADAPLKRRCWRSGEASSWPTTTLPGSDAVGPVGLGAAGDERRRLGVGQGDQLQFPSTRHRLESVETLPFS